MDIGDRHQTFGKLFLESPRDHPAISGPLMQLSAASLGVNASQFKIPASTQVLWQLDGVQQTEGITYLLPMIGLILKKAQSFMEDITGGWNSFFSKDQVSLLGSTFEITQHRVAWLASAGLMSRLGTYRIAFNLHLQSHV